MPSKIKIDKEALVLANDTHKSATAAAASLGLSYQTFCRRCTDYGIAINKNPSGYGLSAKVRYGEQKAQVLSERISSFIRNRPVRDETRNKLRKQALERIDKGKMPSKGLKGYYDGVWFDSSWELAYFVWMVEIKNVRPVRNTKIFFDYVDDCGIQRRTKPDFILPSGELIEIKGYPNVHTAAKFAATSTKVSYLFREDIEIALSYVKGKYGKDFTKAFYATVGKLVDPAE